MSKKEKGFLSGVGSLTIAVILAKVLGAVYRIPLANMLGTEGMGIYQFIYPVFALLLTLSSGAIPTAVSISISELFVNGREEEGTKFFSSTLLMAFVIGLVGSVLLVAIAFPLSAFQSKKALPGYLAIAPSVLIVTLVSCFRGYFNGRHNLIPSSISQITEGIVKLGVGLALTRFLLPYGVSYAVLGALTGVTASEAVTLLIMAIVFFARKNKLSFVPVKTQKENFSKLFRVMIPLIACGTVLPLAQFIDSLLVVNLLRLRGEADATSLYGIWSGMVTPIINLPVMVCLSLGVAITPQMVKFREKRDCEEIIQKGNTAVKIVFFLGMPFVILYLVIPEKILGWMYFNLEQEKIVQASFLLRINAPSVLGIGVYQIYSAILQGLNRIKITVKIILLSMTIKILFTVALTPSMGIIGVAVASLIGYTLAGVWIFIYFIFFTRLEKYFMKNISLIMLCGVIMGALLFITANTQINGVVMILIALLSGLLYFLAIMCLRVFSEEEWKAMPLSPFLVKMDKFINGS